MNRLITLLCVLTASALTFVALSVPADAGTRPVVSALSTHHGPYWGQTVITVHGQNFTHVQKVLFGATTGDHVHVLSSTTLTVEDPEHGYGQVTVRVVTATGTSDKAAANQFIFTHPTMDTPIQGGLTGRQEQRISAQVRSVHRGVHTTPRSSHWTAAMGLTAMRRALSWVGLPYSWAGGNRYGPTAGVCAGDGADMDCRVVGFDCSGLTLYAWAPYKTLAHYAQTQHSQAGRFHPTTGELVPGDLVFFAGYISGGIGHVAIYEGHGMVVQAEQSGSQVKVSRLADVIADDGPYRGATRPVSTGRQGAVPRLSSVTPTLSANGGYLTITGSELGTATSVSVGSTMVYSFVSRSSNRLVVRAPAHAVGRAAVVVSNAWGSAEKTITYLGPPQASRLSPAQGPVTGATTVTVTGTNLATVTRVTAGSASVPFTAVGAGTLTVVLPAHAPGPVQLTLYSPYGASKAITYTYVALPPPSSSPPAIPPSSPTSSDPPSSPTSVPPSSLTSSEPPPPPSSDAPLPSTAPSTDPSSTGDAPSSDAPPGG